MGSIRENIAQNLTRHRKTAGMTQRELAEVLGVKPSAVSNWENGINSIDIETLHKACGILGVSLDEMFGVKIKKPPEPTAEAESPEDEETREKKLTRFLTEALIKSGAITESEDITEEQLRRRKIIVDMVKALFIG